MPRRWRWKRNGTQRRFVLVFVLDFQLISRTTMRTTRSLDRFFSHHAPHFTFHPFTLTSNLLCRALPLLGRPTTRLSPGVAETKNQINENTKTHRRHRVCFGTVSSCGLQQQSVLRQKRSGVGLRYEMLCGWQSHLRHLPDLQHQKIITSIRSHRPKVLLGPFSFFRQLTNFSLISSGSGFDFPEH